MIRVTCSKLEEVRQNPKTFAQQLKLENKNNGGSFGMFQCWQKYVKSSHTGELNVSEAILGLQQSFMGFANNAVNKKRQEFLIDRFQPYVEDFKSRNYTYLGSQKKMLWNIIPDVALTGHTPNLVSNESGFASYFYTENPILWQEQLKFPLIQYYLAKNIFKCDFTAVEVGTYCLRSLSFNLKSYSENEIEDAISETEGIFNVVNEEYKRK
jgi:hypothetical protein